MGIQGDIIRLEVELIKSAMLTNKEQLENDVLRASRLTYEQWVNKYALKFREEVNRVLQKTGKLPTKEQVERVIYVG